MRFALGLVFGKLPGNTTNLNKGITMNPITVFIAAAAELAYYFYNQNKS